MIWERTRRIYLHETDASGLIFFGAVTHWMAEGQMELMRALGYVTMTRGFATPTRAVEIEYLAPLRLHDEVAQRAFVGEVGRTSFAVHHEFSARDGLSVRAISTHVHLTLADLAPSPVPEVIRAASQGEQ